MKDAHMRNYLNICRGLERQIEGPIRWAEFDRAYAIKASGKRLQHVLCWRYYKYCNCEMGESCPKVHWSRCQRDTRLADIIRDRG